MKQRLEYIDIMRGIAILLVLFEHCIGSLKNPVAGIVLSFHMPLFFFISGSCMTQYGGGKNWIIKKAKAILLPQLTLGLICIGSSILFDVVMKRSLSLSEVDYISPFGNWFLPVLFLMELLLMPIITAIKNRLLVALSAILVFILFYFTDYSAITYVQQTIGALVFGLLGYATRPLLDKYDQSNSKYKGFGWLALLLVVLLASINDPVGMYINQYGNKCLFLLTSLVGIFGILDVSVSLKNTSFLQWCGRVSIIIYILQFFLVRVGMACTAFIAPSDSQVGYIITFFIVLTMIIPLSVICNNKLPYLFGKTKHK